MSTSSETTGTTDGTTGVSGRTETIGGGSAAAGAGSEAPTASGTRGTTSAASGATGAASKAPGASAPTDTTSPTSRATGTTDPASEASRAIGTTAATSEDSGPADVTGTAAHASGTGPGAAPERPASGGEAPAAVPVRGTRLTLTGAGLGRPGAPAVSGVDLDIALGEILTVVGSSGCGKSTLLRTLAGLLPPLDGTVEQDGHPITSPAADRALVFQEDALLPWRTLRANVELPLAIKGVPRTERRAQAESWLDRVGLADRARHLPHRVSGGQRQRAQLARALAGAPRAVLMDEPFGALDAQTRAGMQDLLVEVLRGTGATVVFVTHDVDEALFLGDRVALLGAGRLTAVRDIPHPRDRTAHEDPARLALRREVLTSLGT
jgi:NitT/TauT family transport system ATP-binding protein